MENGHEPATKRDVEVAIEAALTSAKDELLEGMRAIETKLLQAFYGYAQSNDRRVVEVETNETFLRTRVATIEARLLEVERRLNMPPTQ